MTVTLEACSNSRQSARNTDHAPFHILTYGNGARSSRATVRSWVLPVSASETHSGTPPGAARACTFPAGSWALPEYHLGISFPFLLVFLSAHRSEDPCVASMIRY